MVDFVAALWREFDVETREHLDAIELNLLTAEGGESIGVEGIALLFRAFHSVKGLARAMDLRGMEVVAHAAESVLSLVRDGTAALDAELVTVLLPALDSLKAGRELALDERRDRPAPEAVLAELKRCFEQLSGGVPLPEENPMVEPGKAAPEPGPAPEIAPEACEPAREDPDVLAYFIELLRSALPIFTRIVTADFAKANIRTETFDTIERIEHAADTMGYHALVNHMHDLRAIVEAAGERRIFPDARKSVLRLLGLIGEVLKEIDHGKNGKDGPVAAGTEAPSADLRRVLGRAFEDELRETYCNFIQALSLLSGESGNHDVALDNDEMLAEDIAGMARLLYSFVLFLNWSRAGNVMLVIEDIFSRVADREVVLGSETIALARSALSTMFGPVVDRDCMPEHWSDISQDVADQLSREFRKSLLDTLNSRRGSLAPIKVGQRFLATLEIKPALLEMLSPENISHLMDLVQVGHIHIYEVLANPEKSPEFTKAFLAWTESQVKPITNRTVFIDGESWFEFLVASCDSPETVFDRVAEIDPAGSFIKVVPCRLKQAPKPAEPGQTAEPDNRTAPTGAPSEAVSGTTPGHTESVMRVRGETVDTLLNQIGEMISLNGALSLSMQDSLVGGALQSLRRGLQMITDESEHPEAEGLIGVVDVLRQYFDKIRQIEGSLTASLARLQEGVLELRVVPVDTVFGRFPRLVRDLARDLGKQVRLEIDGGGVRIDKGMVEALADPLMHMVRNALDHGIESPERRRDAGKPVPATLHLRAFRKGNRVIIEVRDDGAGLDVAVVRRIAVERGLVSATEAARLNDREVCRFIFQPGFSTAAAVTATSGRGVGMDVVWTAVNRLGGAIEVDSQTGKGTAFTLSMPLSAAIQSALIVAADNNMMAIPERYLAETCQITASEVQIVRGQSAILLRDRFLPVFPLTRLLGHPSPGDVPARFPVVVIEDGRQRIGLIVDRLYKRQDLFVKDIHPQLAAIPGVGGASTLGDGRVILILDGDDLFRLAEASVQINADGVGLS
ncbi:MAG: chemotaxis protein CheW [Rhodospirillaceae bacterium]